jgi:hypothetical protein
MTVGTFGANLTFLERFLLPRMPRHVTNRVFLVDADQLHRSLTEGPLPQRLNRTYAAAPIHTNHAFHPKFVLLTGKEEGLLLVGSGNASIDGYAGPGEAFTEYRWNPDNDEHLPAFGAIRQFIETLNEHYPIDDLAWRLIDDQFTNATWLPRNADSSPIIHNLDVPQLDQFVATIDNLPVRELVLHAPFHDERGHAIRDLLQRLNPDKATLLIQPQQTTLNIAATKKATQTLAGALTVVAIEPPANYGHAFLHAKFILARTDTADFLLQGSANLSTVALCRAGAHANVELGNILTGTPGTFDAFLDQLTHTVMPGGLDDVTPAPADPDTPSTSTVGLIRNLTWTPPHLTGTITGQITTLDITIHVNDEPVTPADATVEQTPSVTAFTFTFHPVDCERIDSAHSITVTITGHDPVPAYPYRAADLIRLSSAGHRIDLLREAGSLDLDDKDIADLLHELDRFLIVDGHSIWRIAHPDQPDHDDTDPDTPPIQYDDIDWEAIRNHSTLKAYTAHHAARAASPTELAILLDSLTGRFRAEARRVALPEVDAAGDDLGHEFESEDPDALDEEHAGDATASEAPEDGTRHQSPSTRIRRMWRAFVQRFVNGLHDTAFVDSVGPGIVIPSYIAFNHLIRRLRNRELADADFLTTAQLALWTFMWGDTDNPGYLHALHPDERAAAISAMNQHDDTPVTLTAIDDAYWHAWNEDHDVRPLRDVARVFLSSPDWTISHEGLQDAATATTAEDITNADDLLDDLLELVTTTPETDLDHEIAASAGLRFTDVRWIRETVNRRGRQEDHTVLHLPDDYDLTPDRASTLFAAWEALQPDIDYRRVTAGRKTAFIDASNGEAVHFDRDTYDEIALNLTHAPQAPWVVRLLSLPTTSAA